MADKSGPLAGPRQVTEFITPYYRRTWDMLAARGTRLFDQDSDGDMRPVIDAFLAAGVNCMHPMEPAAGMVTVMPSAGCRRQQPRRQPRYRSAGAVLGPEPTRRRGVLWQHPEAVTIEYLAI